MGKKTKEQSGRQTLSTIPEDDVYIEKDKDAANLFYKLDTGDGQVLQLFHKDERIQQYHAKKALALTSEENPDMSTEDILKEQQRILEDFSKEKEAPAARRGRGRGGRNYNNYENIQCFVNISLRK